MKKILILLGIVLSFNLSAQKPSTLISRGDTIFETNDTTWFLSFDEQYNEYKLVRLDAIYSKVSGTGDLVSTNNLSDVSDSTEALANLAGVFGLVPDQTDYPGTMFLGNYGVDRSNTGSLSEGSANTYIGIDAGLSTTIAKFNTSLGAGSLESTTSGWANTAIGHNALSTGVGTGSLVVSGSGGEFYANTAIGSSAMLNSTTASYNVAVGVNALLQNTEGHNNVAIGVHSLDHNLTGIQNVAIGRNTLYTGTSVDNSVGIGNQALFAATAGINTAIGAEALFSNTTGSFNTAIGYRALYDNLTGQYNTAIGYEVLTDALSSFNVGIGYRALFAATSGERNMAIGHASGSALVTGSNNSLYGMQSGAALTGSNNTLIGYQSGIDITSGANNIVLGSVITVPSITGDYQLNIGDFLTGSMTGNKYLTVDGTVTISDTMRWNDTNSEIYEDGSSNLVFKDAVTGVKTLAELSAAGSGDLLAANNLSDLVDDPTAVSNLGFTATVGEVNAITDGITLETTIADDDTDIPTSGAVVDFVNGNTFDIDTTVWLLSDTVIIGSAPERDSFNTTWYYPIFDNSHGSDTVPISNFTIRCKGTTVDFTLDLIKNDTLMGISNDTIVSAWNITDETGALIDASSLSNVNIAPGEIVWWKLSAITTEPDYLLPTVSGYRKNNTY